jgi:hypothetical protein
VALLETGDVIDPKIGDRVFKTKSSEELRGLEQVVEWAKAAGLVRVVKGRLVPVKKSAALLDRPAAVPNQRKLLRSRAVVVSVAEKAHVLKQTLDTGSPPRAWGGPG